MATMSTTIFEENTNNTLNDFSHAKECTLFNGDESKCVCTLVNNVLNMYTRLCIRIVSLFHFPVSSE